MTWTLDVRLTLDTRAAFGWQGGTFSVDFQNQSGRNGSDVLTGDVQGFDNADADGRTQVSEIWYEQLLLDNRLRIKVGKVDANTEFALPQFTGEFLNSSFGYSPTITGLPTYPDPAMSVNVFVYPTRHLYAGVGVYDGSGSRGVLTGSYGPASLWHEGASAFTIAEAGVRWVLNDDTLPGRFAFGGHYATGDFTRFDGSTQSGTGGVYAVFDQKLWHPNFYDKTNENGVYLSLQYGHTGDEVSEVTDHFGAGVTWIGPYAKRNPDALGVGVTAVRLSHAPGSPFTTDAETAIEGFYAYRVTQYLTVKPDLQYIIHPGGDATVEDALVFTLRVSVAF